MNILFDIGHPAHVHLLKNTISYLKLKHNIYITIKEIDTVKFLLEKYSFNYINLGRKKISIIGKAFSQIRYFFAMMRLIRKNKIDLLVGSSITIAQVSYFSKAKSIVLDDDDDAVEPLFVKFGHTFADHILTPDCILRNSRKAIYYKGYHELAYLHPNHFKPDPEILTELELLKEETFFVLRFVAFKGHHDIGMHGISTSQKRELIDLLSSHGRIFITSESKIDDEFEKFRISLSPEKIHSLVYYCSMFLGDSQTMTTEAALLGVPALKCNTFAGILSVPNELETKYGLCYSYLPENFSRLLLKVSSILEAKDAKEKWKTKRGKLLENKIDVSSFLCWAIEEYPSSMSTLKSSAEYQNRFKTDLTDV